MTTLTWDEALHQLWIYAIRHRGMSVATSPGQMPDGVPQGWPRTRGSDVLAIASVVDPIIRALPMATGGFGIERRWRHCASDLADLALARPTHEYAKNPAFWATLATTLMYLASINAPVPHDLWRALLAEIANPSTSSDFLNEDCLHLAADSYEELWRVQKATLSELRGVDSHELSADTNGPRRTVPRTTNADILQLAAFWSLALIKVEQRRRAFAPDVVATLGLDGVKRRWRAVMADVEAYARTGDPQDVYPRNHAFWRATASVAVTISAIDDLPLSLDLTVSGQKSNHRNVRSLEIKEPTFDKAWTAQRDQMLKARGGDLREPPPGATDSSMQAMQMPRTTNADVVQLAAYWNSAWTQLENASRRGDGSGHTADLPSLVEERTRWQATMADVEQIAKPGNPGDVYPKNSEFWRASLALANALVAFDQKPAPTQLSLNLPDEGLDSLVDAAKHLGGQIAGAAGSIAHAIGNIAHEAGAGLFSGFRTPLLVGAGGLALLWFLFCRRDREAA